MTSKAKKPRSTRRAAKPDLQARGAAVVSVFGPFNSRVMIEMSADTATELFPKAALAAAGRSALIDAVERDLAALRERAPEVADSALAATAVRLAYELEDPYNSATSKSMCARVLLDTMERLRELAPPERKKDTIDRIGDDLAARRERHARSAAAADPAGS